MECVDECPLYRLCELMSEFPEGHIAGNPHPLWDMVLYILIHDSGGEKSILVVIKKCLIASISFFVTCWKGKKEPTHNASDRSHGKNVYFVW